MNNTPYSVLDWIDQNLESVQDFKIVTLFGENLIRPLYVIVECWHHKNYGKTKREYLKTFSEKERKLIGRYHTYLYQWFMRTGIPRNGVGMKLETYNLLGRAANFFAEH